MNENPATPPLIPLTSEFKDRRTGLVLFGVLEILLGCLCALLVPLMFWGHTMSTRMMNSPPNYRMIIPALGVYAVMAVVFFWLGIGSIQARRWARALLLILSWSWLVVGICALAFAAVLLPQVLGAGPVGGQQMPVAAKTIALLVGLAFMSLLFLILPGALVLFYRSKNVKATCDARDPVVRWTDACPLPVLALSLFLSAGTLGMLSMPLAYNSVLPFFGTLITGLPGTLLVLLVAALCGYAARATYRLNPAGWWIAVAIVSVFTVSNVITFTRVDLMEMYRLMGYPEQQIQQMQQFSFLKSETMIWWSLAVVLPVFGYLIYVKKFFRRGVQSHGVAT